MNVRDLIAALQDMPADAEVRLATQPNYPVAFTIEGVVSPDALAGEVECEAHGNYSCEEGECLGHVVWITEGGHPEDSPYAPPAVFDAVAWY